MSDVIVTERTRMINVAISNHLIKVYKELKSSVDELIERNRLGGGYSYHSEQGIVDIINSWGDE